jgi:hypothetical protein
VSEYHHSGTRCGTSSTSVPCKGKSTQPVRVRPKEVSVHLSSYPGDGRVTVPSIGPP